MIDSVCSTLSRHGRDLISSLRRYAVETKAFSSAANAATWKPLRQKLAERWRAWAENRQELVKSLNVHSRSSKAAPTAAPISTLPSYMYSLTATSFVAQEKLLVWQVSDNALLCDCRCQARRAAMSVLVVRSYCQWRRAVHWRNINKNYVHKHYWTVVIYLTVPSRKIWADVWDFMK